jgi:hypothetical protein
MTSGGLFDCFTDSAGVFLNPPQQFLGLAFDVLKFVVRELGPLLFQLAFDDVAVAFDFEFVHRCF